MKKLVKTRTARSDTLEAMTCSCRCPPTCDCTNCSGGGSFTAEEGNNRRGPYTGVSQSIFINQK